MEKTIYALAPLAQTLQAVNQRYLKFISDIQTPEVGLDKLQRLTQTRSDHDHCYKGFYLLTEADALLFRTLLRGEFVSY
jgi:hypothetical protein